MKSVYVFIAFSITPFFVSAQEKSDTSRIVELKEIQLSSVQKNASQAVVSFFKSSNASTLEDILTRLPEFSLVRRGAYGMEPSIRSFSSGQINVLVDGMRIHGACTDKMDPATIYIEPVNLDNLQAQTGSNGFMYGSSIGGTVNMKMAEPDFRDNKKISGNISSGYQSAAKSLFESAILNYSSDKWAFRASSTYRKSDAYLSGGGTVINFSQFEKINYSLSVKYQHCPHTWYKADILGDDGWNISYPALPMDVGYAGARIASLSYHSEYPSKKIYKWVAKIYANKIRHFMDDSKRPNVPMHMDMPGLSKTIGVYTEGELKINKKQNLQFRADGSTTFLKADMTMHQSGQPDMYMLTWPDNRRNQFGISGSWQLSLDSTTKLQLTARADYIDHTLTTEEAKDHVSIFSPSANDRNDILKNLSFLGSKKILKAFKATLSFSYSERMPTAGELFGFYLFNANDNYDYIGNPALKTEKNLQAEVSLQYTKKQNRVQLTGFISRISDYILGQVEPSFSHMTIGASGVKTYSNIPFALIAGIEASTVVKPAKTIDVVSTLRFTAGRDNNKYHLPNISPLKNVTSVRWQHKKLFVQGETEIAAKQTRFSPRAGEDATAGYSLFHFRTGYTINLKNTNLELQAGAENILDKKYHEHLDWGNIVRPGRNLYILVKIIF
ncbi:MAG: TonB-dependent receptor [Chitinophagaceae bacterium]|nr:TonB-dependent receptor [Chitinophagaceae bacterium]MBK8951305.1 TonB-dependent receptor [Chitinophagaceae bacterium]